MKNFLMSKWTELSPKTRQLCAMGFCLAAIIFAVSFSGDGKTVSEKKKDMEDEGTVGSLLTGSNTRDLGFNSLVARVKKSENERVQMERKVSRLSDQLETLLSRRNQPDTRIVKKIEEIENEISLLQLSEVQPGIEEELLNNKERQEDDLITIAQDGSINNGNNSDTSNDQLGSFNLTDEESENDPVYLESYIDDEAEYFATLSDYQDPNQVNDNSNPISNIGNQMEQDGSSEVEQKYGLKIIGEVFDESVNPIVDTDTEEVYLPAGSLISGVLIHGMDAPTGSKASSNPYPSMLRVQAEAILPNYYSADVRECFIGLSGYGDLSSTRAIIRTTFITCIDNEGGISEATAKGYAVGEDSKVGIRGRKVTKQADMVINSMIAGGLGTFSSAFSANEVPTIATSDGTVQLDNLLSAQMAQSATTKGMSSAFDRLAQFYIDLAESTLPIIEIDAGRNIDISLSHGLKLIVKSKVKG